MQLHIGADKVCVKCGFQELWSMPSYIGSYIRHESMLYMNSGAMFPMTTFLIPK